jgi:uroporphyrinogen decarboxylase
MTAPLLLSALRREKTARPPVWLMRQAGRYLPEYQAVRKRAGGFLPMIDDPPTAAEITLQPVRRFDVDAAILFSDILVPLRAMGLELRVDDGRGPWFPKPLAGATDIRALRLAAPAETMPEVGQALRLTRAGLPPGKALLGFAGAPFTLASYAIEGGSSASHAKLRRLMYREPALYAELMDKLATVVGWHLAYQVECGADAVVLFDTWAGALTREDYAAHVAPWSRKALQPVSGLAPRMAFVRDGTHLLDDVVSLGVEAVALDWRTDIGAAFDRHGGRVAIQGHLDPAALLATPDEVTRRTRAILDVVGGRPGHVLALGHGVLKETDPECVAAFVRCAKERAR